MCMCLFSVYLLLFVKSWRYILYPKSDGLQGLLKLSAMYVRTYVGMYVCLYVHMYVCIF